MLFRSPVMPPFPRFSVPFSRLRRELFPVFDANHPLQRARDSRGYRGPALLAAVLRSALLILRSVLFTFPARRASFPGIYLRCLTACPLSQERPSRLIGGT